MIWGENIPPSLIQNSMLGKKRGGAPQIRQKFKQLGFVTNVQGNLRPIKGCDWRWKISPPISQNSILGKKKGGGHPKSGKNSTNSDLSQIFRVILDQKKILIGGEKIYRASASGKKGWGHPKLGKNSNNLDLAETFRVTSGQ